jgi:capsule polysaccharide export protein KpsE/RkpR
MNPQSARGPTANTGAPLEPQHLAWLLLWYRRVIITVPAVLFLVVSTLTLTSRRKYSSTMAFTPASTTTGLANVSGLAAQFGITLPGQGPEDSPIFYADLIRTDSFLRELAQTRFEFTDRGEPRSGTLIDLYEIEEGTPEKTLYEAVRLLREELVSISPNRQTGVVSVTVRTRWPACSPLMTGHLLKQVNAFNLRNRSNQAGAERDFIQHRLDTAAVELRTAENRLQEFLRKNREYSQDPSLVFEHDRLTRDMTLRQQVYTTLVQSFEQARIEAVRNTPSITVVEPPSQPLRPDRRNTVLKALLAIIAGFGIAFAYVVIMEFLRNSDRKAEAGTELQRLWREAQKDLGPFKGLVPRRWRSAGT